MDRKDFFTPIAGKSENYQKLLEAVLKQHFTVYTGTQVRSEQVRMENDYSIIMGYVKNIAQEEQNDN